VNYYEELGIHRDATTDEVREAYKLAARLLHPDMQQDPRLKDLAECQMRRLGEVVAVLADPWARARYDAALVNRPPVALLARFTQAGRAELVQAAVRHWFWVLLGIMTLGTGVWYGLARVTDAPPESAAAQRPSPPAAPVVTQAQPTTMQKPRVEAPQTANAGRRQPVPSQTESQEPDPAVSAPPTPPQAPSETAAVEPARVREAPNARPADVPRNEASRFEGEWLLSADARGPDTAGTYPAKYVELRLRQEGGILTGDYRALHTVLDKAISPEVAFRVRGKSPAGNSGALHWESSSGAKGELDLTLRSPGQMQVNWWTTQFGTQESLGSGMAVLVRLKTP
jgi:curved DNA-binding protein CbpA